MREAQERVGLRSLDIPQARHGTNETPTKTPRRASRRQPVEIVPLVLEEAVNATRPRVGVQRVRYYELY